MTIAYANLLRVNASRALKLRGGGIPRGASRLSYFPRAARMGDGERAQDLSKKIKTKPVRRLAEQESERGKERRDE